MRCAHQPFHSQEWSISNFSCSLTRTITVTQYEGLGVSYLLRWNVIRLPVLTTSLIHSLWKVGRMYTFHNSLNSLCIIYWVRFCRGMRDFQFYWLCAISLLSTSKDSSRTEKVFLDAIPFPCQTQLSYFHHFCKGCNWEMTLSIIRNTTVFHSPPSQAACWGRIWGRLWFFASSSSILRTKKIQNSLLFCTYGGEKAMS